jgi:hypothetical protein
MSARRVHSGMRTARCQASTCALQSSISAMPAFATPVIFYSPHAPLSSVVVFSGFCQLARPSRRRSEVRQRRQRRVLALSHSGVVGGGGSGSSGSAADEPAVLADRIACAFVDACTPSEAPYSAQVARFCREALNAYRTGYSLVALQLEMSGASTGIGRALASDEVELRSVWLSLVYKTLRQIRFPSASSEQSAEPGRFDRDRLDDFVNNIVTAVRKGYDMKRIQLEQALTVSDGKERPRTPLESAILNQSTRIIIITLRVADEVSEASAS